VRSHDEYKENLGAYVLGALPELEVELFERHLATCETCRAEVDELSPVTSAIARSVPQVEPPAALKASLMAIVNEEAELRGGVRADEPRRARTRLPMPAWLAGIPPRFAVAGALAVLALGVVIGVAADKSSRGPSARTVAAAVNHLPRGAATLQVSAQDREATVSLRGAPRLPAGRVYQLWIQRGKMIERGPVFTVDKSGRGSSTIPGGVRGANAVMMTVEHAPGADAPTSAPVVRFDV
jgi:anti-sigma factor RsiW